jgi:SAM-dependent methyltransferase
VSFVVAPDAYDRFMGRYSIPLASVFADFAGVAVGQRILDVGCGPGALTAVLGDRVGAESVTAVDPSEPFVAAVRARHPLSAANVPIQGNTGTPGSVVNLTNPGGAVNLQWGPIQPVSQLGSQQLTSGKLAKNADG